MIIRQRFWCHEGSHCPINPRQAARYPCQATMINPCQAARIRPANDHWSEGSLTAGDAAQCCQETYRKQRRLPKNTKHWPIVSTIRAGVADIGSISCVDESSQCWFILLNCAHRKLPESTIPANIKFPQCWNNVGVTLHKHWLNICCLLGYSDPILALNLCHSGLFLIVFLT